MLTYSNIENGMQEPWFGTGCISSDPLFVNPTTNDFSLGWTNYPQIDGTKSPCIDSGDPDSPNDPDQSRVDMGALPYGWATTSGSVSYDGNPVCAMVLANGQYVFTCKSGDDFGKYQLSVPLDNNGKITVQAFVSGLSPFRQTTDTSILNIAMQATTPEMESPSVVTTVSSDTSTPSGSSRITGTVTLDGSSLCAMVLANGQYMFSCGDNNGVYDLTVPLDGNGQITLFVFVSGLQPYKRIFAP